MNLPTSMDKNQWKRIIVQPQNLTNGQTSSEDMQNKKKGLRASQSFDEAVLGGQDEQLNHGGDNEHQQSGDHSER